MSVQKKTNAMRLLDAAKTTYRIYEYDVSDGAIDAVSIARKIGEAPEQVFKTLVTESPAHENFVFIIPAPEELDLKAAAKISKQKSIEMIPSRTLLPLTGYLHGGCSPLGMKKLFRTYIDETAILYDYICVSGGQIGTNMAISPDALAQLVHAEFADLIKKKKEQG